MIDMIYASKHGSATPLKLVSELWGHTNAPADGSLVARQPACLR